MNESNYVELVELRKHFGSVKALDGLNLEIKKGELVSLLGPSGCGKTTALRALAGLQELDSGSVKLDSKDITNLKPNLRNMGMVFQSYSLFPHMSALENVEYGLRMKVNRKEGSIRKNRANEMLELVGLSTHTNHFPHQLSGGQQQRVALARALAIEPRMLLLDEPLSALDAKVRTQLREEIRRIQIEVGATTLFVTHDQEEALSVSDRVGVMRNGKLEQIAAPSEIYNKPLTSFVAEFVGLTNSISVEVRNGVVNLFGKEMSTLQGSITSGTGIALVRPESITLSSSKNSNARILNVSFLGSLCRVSISLNNEQTVIAQIPATMFNQLNLESGVEIGIDISSVFVKAF